MKVVYNNDFVKSAKLIPKPIQIKLSTVIEILKINPFYPKLHTKPLVGELKGFYSLRITRDWRVIFNFINSETIFLVVVAHRKDIYK